MAQVEGAVLAATNGGLLRDGRPVPSPPGLRAIESLRPLVVALSDGRRLRQEGADWVPAAPAQRTRDLDRGLALNPGDPWPLAVPPPLHAYAALRVGPALYAGTAEGLYRFDGRAWAREALPGDLPLARPNGIAKVGETYVVGGLGGLFVGRPGDWKKAGDDAIRQVAAVGKEVWAVHGNGAADKLEPAADRLYPDVLAGNARRPWTSCVGWEGEAPLFGGLGGWSERAGGGRFPAELKNDVVTALAGRDGVRWVGAQKSGLFRFRGGQVYRWNPGNGLPDTWVTALLRTPSGLVVGTAHRGLFRVVGDRIAPMASPSPRVTSLGRWRERLVVGGMDGAWIANGSAWAPLVRGEEATSVAALGDRLAVTTAAGAFFFDPPTPPDRRGTNARRHAAGSHDQSLQ